MTIIYVISIKDVISPKLLSSKMATHLFDKEMSSIVINNITIDFSGVKSISHSFAHQYLTYKQNSKKKIREINMPGNICRVIKLVQQEVEITT